MKPLSFSLALALTVFAPPSFGAKGDDLLRRYFELETAKTEESFLAGINSKEDWLARQDKYRGQLFSMLGIDPNRPRTDLKATVTGKAEGTGFVVEKLHYQSSPGLYVTGNLYLPAERKPGEKFPAILYVCGHGRVKKGGVSYGNKVHYHHHGAWFARNGFVCLTIDTIQLGEIEGLHHGIYSKNMWWWASRGYTPAGVEAWNGIRGIDYLQSRPEVDGERIGVTGRSGGGAYSWWVAALDERVKAAVPVAGITSMRNHVVDGCVEGHCDCMYQVNAARWDYAMISSLVAPRALLISNTDKDRIFPLDGVVDVHRKTKRVYDMLGVPGNLGLHVTEGPHKDTQDLRVHAFSWFNRFLKKENPLIDKPAVKYFEPEQLKVFEKLPADEITSKIHDTFVPQVAPPPVPKDKASWNAYRKATMARLKEHVFAGWPESPGKVSNKKALDLKADGIRLAAYDFTSQQPWELRLFVAHRKNLSLKDADLVVLNVLDEKGWGDFAATYGKAFPEAFEGTGKMPAHAAEAFGSDKRMFENQDWAMVYVAPRGIGPTAWSGDARKRNHILRRFYLLGQTLDGMRVFDVVRSAQALRGIEGLGKAPLWMQAHGHMAANLLYASLYVPEVTRLDLHYLPASHMQGPAYLNVLRHLDLPQTVALAAERARVVLYQPEAKYDPFPAKVAKALELGPKAFAVRKSMADE
ncbi:MAG: prolyl oligopeptidase family serine peptidase [Verrucomicrobia bacterium]|nr:acetylxylan esterase [Verrucomicrobiota bacterium]MDA0724485.1 prolyl oligopeptidase family serine peptidase [Verrucomicrobiota bacterium]MDA1048749.1 prolyl oligopeptidase family serine peptidase [Verrucomicrobiota bacterium]